MAASDTLPAAGGMHDLASAARTGAVVGTLGSIPAWLQTFDTWATAAIPILAVVYLLYQIAAKHLEILRGGRLQ